MNGKYASRCEEDFRSSLNISQQTTGSRKSAGRTIADYELFNQYVLGHGRFGTVLKARDKQDGKWYALKKINKNKLKKGQHELLIQEIMMHKHLRHHNIVRMRNYFEDKTNLYLVIDFAENGSPL